jgi:hypothetical protein
MAQQTTADNRSTDLKQKMAEAFAEFEADYCDADWCSIIYEDNEVVLIADHAGNEHSEWADEHGDFDEFTQTMHDLAGQLSDRNWPADYPVVFDKLE